MYRHGFPGVLSLENMLRDLARWNATSWADRMHQWKTWTQEVFTCLVTTQQVYHSRRLERQVEDYAQSTHQPRQTVVRVRLLHQRRQRRRNVLGKRHRLMRGPR